MKRSYGTLRNVLLYGVNKYNVTKLQKIQNALCRIVFRLDKTSHVTPHLQKLHWLPISYRILFKYNLITFKAIKFSQPSYLSSLIKPSSLTRGNRLSLSLVHPKKAHGPGVEIFKFYLSKLNEKCERLPFRHSDSKTNGTTMSQLEKILVSIMKRISKKVGLSYIYTCHSVRASTITTLFQAGISLQGIIAITTHKNTSSFFPLY